MDGVKRIIKTIAPLTNKGPDHQSVVDRAVRRAWQVMGVAKFFSKGWGSPENYAE